MLRITCSESLVIIYPCLSIINHGQPLLTYEQSTATISFWIRWSCWFWELWYGAEALPGTVMKIMLAFQWRSFYVECETDDMKWSFRVRVFLVNICMILYCKLHVIYSVYTYIYNIFIYVFMYMYLPHVNMWLAHVPIHARTIIPTMYRNHIKPSSKNDDQSLPFFLINCACYAAHHHEELANKGLLRTWTSRYQCLYRKDIRWHQVTSISVQPTNQRRELTSHTVVDCRTAPQIGFGEWPRCSEIALSGAPCCRNRHGCCE